MNIIMKILIMLSVIFMIGCQQTTDQSTIDRENNNNITQISTEDDLSSNEDLANHLAEIAVNVPNVNQANALIAGPYAVVGIDVDKDLDRSSVGIIKYSVSEALSEDSYGKTAVVIADGDVRQRLKNMQKSISDGQPIQGIVDELAEIVGRYIPSMPPEEDHYFNEEQQEDIMSDEEQNELEDIQEEQSTE